MKDERPDIITKEWTDEHDDLITQEEYYGID